MKLKTLLKINIYIKYIMDFISHITNSFLILLVFLFTTIIFSCVIKFISVNHEGSISDIIGYLSFAFAIDIFVICPCLIGIYFVLYLFFELVVQKMLPFKISDNDKMIISYLINKFHNKNSHSYTCYASYTKLHLELIKLEKAFNNQSDVYKEISEDDFPSIHKFIRRFKQNKQSNSSQEKRIVHQGELINTRNIEHLNLSIEQSNPKLLTLDSVDNELNDLIYYQMNSLKKEKV